MTAVQSAPLMDTRREWIPAVGPAEHSKLLSECYFAVLPLGTHLLCTLKRT